MSVITTPTFAQLAQELAFMQCFEIEGVKGVWHVDSGNPGPVLGITIHTHGNEPSGLAALWYFRNQFDLRKNLKRGSMFFVLNNMRATEQYFTAINVADLDERERQKTKARFCDVNMNRLPSNAPNIVGDGRYEIIRTQELRPIWQKFEVAFDIHSVSKKSGPMIIACGGLQPDLIRGFPVDTIITNIEKIQVDKPAVSFYGGEDSIRTLAIEAGSHEDDSSLRCSIACTMALLQNLGLIEGQNDAIPREYKEYFVDGSVILFDASYEMVKVFEMFEPIKQGQILARCGKDQIIATFDGHALMGRPTTKPDFLNEEMLFLSRPVKKLMI